MSAARNLNEGGATDTPKSDKETAEALLWRVPRCTNYHDACKSGEAAARAFLHHAAHREACGGVLQSLVLRVTESDAAEVTKRGYIVGLLATIDECMRRLVVERHISRTFEVAMWDPKREVAAPQWLADAEDKFNRADANEYHAEWQAFCGAEKSERARRAANARWAKHKRKEAAAE